VWLRLRVDRPCLKYERKRKTNKEKKGKREAVRVGQEGDSFAVCLAPVVESRGRVKVEAGGETR